MPVHCVASRIPWNTVSFTAPLSPMKEWPHSPQITLHFRATQQSSSSGKHENKLRHFCLLEYTTEVLRLRSLSFSGILLQYPVYWKIIHPKSSFLMDRVFSRKIDNFLLLEVQPSRLIVGPMNLGLLNVLWFREQTIPHIELKFLVLFWP